MTKENLPPLSGDRVEFHPFAQRDNIGAHEWIRNSLRLTVDQPYRFDYYAQLIENMRASPWLPIETAPMHRELILFAVMPGGRPSVKVGSQSEHGWHIYGASWIPTHYMPIPPLPEPNP